MNDFQPSVYIVSNKYHNVLYTGVTSNLPNRIHQHKFKLIKGFTKKYNCSYLVYYVFLDTMINAISHEKHIKKKSKQFKIDLIEEINPNWLDLYEYIV